MSAEDLVKDFKYHSLLNQDQGGRRIILQGSINDKPALLLAERAAFSIDQNYLDACSQLVTNIKNLGDNDIYKWYMANSVSNGSTTSPPDLKLNLIYPCKDSHIKKYSFQQSRSVIETPEIYKQYVRPYMSKCREEGRLNWVFNILDGRTEQENVLFRSEPTGDVKDDYILLPDLNWDRTTIGSLHLLAIVQRRDIWSVRDLTKNHVAWLRGLRKTLTDTIEKLYPGVEADMLKLYLHCECVWAVQDYSANHARSTYILSPAHPYRACQSRRYSNTGHRQGVRLRQRHQPARNNGRGRQCWYGRC